jgi:small subunit ribosomal protein S3
MGQKVNPNGLRLGINRDWSTHWYADKKTFATYLDEDVKIRNYLEKKIGNFEAGVSRVDIERVKNVVTVTILTSHPAIVIGQDSAQIKAIKLGLQKLLKKDAESVNISIVEIKNPDLDAMLIAKDIANQIVNRASFRVVQKKANQRVMRAGAMGVKTMTKGRIGGAEIARYEEYREGTLSLHTLRQAIDYAYYPAKTTYGVIGVKVWIALPENYKELKEKRPEQGRFGRGRFNGKRDNNKNGRRPAAAVTPNAAKDSEKGE